MPASNAYKEFQFELMNNPNEKDLDYVEERIKANEDKKLSPEEQENLLGHVDEMREELEETRRQAPLEFDDEIESLKLLGRFTSDEFNMFINKINKQQDTSKTCLANVVDAIESTKKESATASSKRSVFSFSPNERGGTRRKRRVKKKSRR
jgi:hypothetical protein